jgi:GGDEF domain-containing protein
MASILRTTFRGTDVIGRLGGDEFVIAGKASSFEISRAVERLEAATTRPDDSDGLIHSLRFSSGHVTTDGIRIPSLERHAPARRPNHLRNQAVQEIPSPHDRFLLN